MHFSVCNTDFCDHYTNMKSNDKVIVVVCISPYAIQILERCLCVLNGIFFIKYIFSCDYYTNIKSNYEVIVVETQYFWC